MIEELKRIQEEINNAVVKSADELEGFRMKFISKKSVFQDLFEQFKQLPGDQKRDVGQTLNEVKNLALEKFKELANSGTSSSSANSGIDLTLPPVAFEEGSIHPITQTYFRIIEIFERLGFNVADGPEMETDWNNFTALNFPPNHPARQMQDTYFLSEDKENLLRTHTSNVQIRMMTNNKPPFRAIMPGRVYRNEAISARAHCFFHQVEGLVIDKDISFKDLKQTLYHFSKEMFGKDTQIRLRPSYFPFTEPSAEIDISCFICKGEGCKICKHSGWVEIAGSGVVDPNVLENCGIDPNEYSGFAFGMGIERIAMLKYQLDDIRLFSENDLRFLRQF